MGYNSLSDFEIKHNYCASYRVALVGEIVIRLPV